MNNKKWLITAAAILMLTLLVSCAAGNGGSDVSDTDDAIDALGTAEEGISTDGNDTSADTDTAETDTDSIETETNADAVTDTKSDAIETETETETEAETETEPAETEPEYTNPLTGLASEVDLSDKRPVAIMINNLQKACPQAGVSDADVMYEILAEGGITRLMMFVTEYEKLGIVGAVRSSRHYYLNFVRDFDAIYVHAGASEMAYSAIDERDFANLDGVRMYLGSMFYRDAWRKKNMGTEHSLMTTGEGIVGGIKQKKYRTTHSDSYEEPLTFVDYGTRLDLDGDAATHVMLKYHKSQIVDFAYDAETDTYLRYQFDGVPHIDCNNDEQLRFDNIIILLTDMWVIPNDYYNHLEVITTGKGDGYFVAGGEYIPIKWSRATDDSQLKLTDTDGNEIVLNRGKTFVSVFDKDSKYSIDASKYMPND